MSSPETVRGAADGRRRVDQASPGRAAERHIGAGVRRRPLKPTRIALYAMLVVVLFLVDAPLVWMATSSVKSDRETAAYPPTIVPRTVTGQNYRNLFKISDFGTYLRNSAVVATGATALTIAIGICAAYALTRFRFRFLRGIGEISLFAYMIPPILILVPIARIVSRAHLTNNLASLTLLYTATLLPFALWILRSYVHGIPIDLEHAAMIDGCTRCGAFYRVIVPQALPGIISTAIFTFNSAWSEYLFASTLMTSPGKRTLSPGLALLLDQTGVYSWGVLMAASVIMVMPVILLFAATQRQLVSGLGEGAVKG